MPAKLDFKEIAQNIDVEAVAKWLGLEMKEKANNIRCECPTCGGDERTLQIFPETNSFRCYKAEISGDVISFYGHCQNYTGMYRAAKELSEHFATAPAVRTAPSTAPKSPTRREEKQETSAPTFDPEKFASKLQYTDEVEALGLSEADAARLGIGFYRGRVYMPMKDDTGFICGFIGFADGQLKMPPKWLQQNKVVKLRA